MKNFAVFAARDGRALASLGLPVVEEASSEFTAIYVAPIWVQSLMSGWHIAMPCCPVDHPKEGVSAFLRAHPDMVARAQLGDPFAERPKSWARAIEAWRDRIRWRAFWRRP